MLKNAGQAYISQNGKRRRKKELLKPCNKSCKLRCYDKLSEEERRVIFNEFWAIGDHSKQYHFIVDNIVKMKTKRTVISHGISRRTCTNVYHLPYNQNRPPTKLIVCKAMFVNTLNCGDKMIRTALRKAADRSSVALVDNRGRKPYKKATAKQMQSNF